MTLIASCQHIVEPILCSAIKEFIDIILNGISDTFDIYHNYWFNNRKFVIYAYNYKYSHKFHIVDSV